MKFPNDAVTPKDKLEFLYIAQEKLRLEHNAKGDDFRNGVITENEFRDYQKNSFGIRQQKISKQIAVIQPLVFERRVSGETLVKGAAKATRNIAIKETFKASVRFNPDIVRDLNGI